MNGLKVYIVNRVGYRRRDGEVQRWRGLANQARAEGQALQAKRDEEAALYGEQVWPCLHPAMPHCMQQHKPVHAPVQHAKWHGAL